MSLADRLNVARQRQFVGRNTELTLFSDALAVDDLPFCVLHIFGPGGVGKTTLLREFAWLCAQQQIPVLAIDARNTEPIPDTFLSTLRHALHIAPDESPLAVLAANQQRQVILLDTYEILTPLDDWLRTVFLPQLPAQTLVVLAGRHPPEAPWRIDAGWQTLLRTLPLRNLSQEESRTYLSSRAVPAEQHPMVLHFTHGHPLALSLAAEAFAQDPNMLFEPEAHPDMIKTLLDHFVQQAPGPDYRSALEVCALLRLTSEAILAEMALQTDVHDLFSWLRGLSFIESGRQGLFPHDIVREALHADLRWRNPDLYAELHRRARAVYAKRLQQTQGVEQQHILIDYIYLHRKNAVVRQFYAWQQLGGIIPVPVRESDRLDLVAMVQRHEGEESAHLAAHWLARQPQGTMAFRDTGVQLGDNSKLSGFMQTVALEQINKEDLELDPAVRSAWHYLQQTTPLRPGERATMFRFWMAADTYQSTSPTQNVIMIHTARHYLSTPGLAFTFLPCADPEFWLPLLTYANLARLPAADFEVGARHYGVYGHDWRMVPPAAWLALMAEREMAAETPVAPSAAALPQITVLNELDFAQAARDALHNFARPNMLRSNPLIHTRLVTEQVGAAASNADRIAALQALLQETCEQLRASPRDTKLYRAVYHTYLQPASTQEQAAELLDIPFGTFRRHLKAGITRIVETLWQRELQGSNN
jgi:hypothetical protein